MKKRVTHIYYPPTEGFILVATALLSLLFHSAVFIWEPGKEVHRRRVFLELGEHDDTPEVTLKQILIKPKKRKRKKKTIHKRIVKKPKEKKVEREIASKPVVRNFKKSVLNQKKPVYPRSALRNNWEGEVGLQFRIGPTGEVLDVVIVEPSHRASFNRSALGSAKTWRFRPAPDGKEYTLFWTVKFRLKDS